VEQAPAGRHTGHRAAQSVGEVTQRVLSEPPGPRGVSSAAVRAMCDWRPRQAIAGDRAAAATKDL
jgi:hypothetical protein